MIRSLALFFGAAFVLGGTLGFVPGVTQNGLYFGIFVVNTAHNVMHIASGVIFIIASALGRAPPARGSRLSGSFTPPWPRWASRSATG